MRLKHRGTWPGRVEYRRGLSMAVARPWNEHSTDAHLRIVRGNSLFVKECAAVLLDLGANRVLSPPLTPGMTGLWKRGGFAPSIVLDLYQRDLLRAPSPPALEVVVGRDEDWTAAAAIDKAAFPPEWGMGELGLEEAMSATPTSIFLAIRGDNDQITSFAVVGAGVKTGYLQRVAVDPSRRRTGEGRSLVRASIRWAQRRGCSTMLLNTQTDNEPAAALYESEGFTLIPAGLEIWAFDG